MTKDERLAQTEARAKKRLSDAQAALAKIHATRRADAARDLADRQALVGKLAYEAGLFAWSDTDLTGLFAALAILRGLPEPVKTLTALLETEVWVQAQERHEMGTVGKETEARGAFDPSD